VSSSTTDSGKTYLPTYDGNGNVGGLLNADTGALAASYEYSPFGEPIREQSPDGTIADQPFRFSTKYADIETGLIYYGRRFYDPRLGRWLSRDPKEEIGGVNLYGFVGNNGINKWDYLGMCDAPDDNSGYSGDGDLQSGDEAPNSVGVTVDGLSVGKVSYGSSEYNEYLSAYNAQQAKQAGSNSSDSSTSNGKIAGSTAPTASNSAGNTDGKPAATTYTGQIAYQYVGAIISTGTFSGTVSANGQAYDIAGNLLGFGFQLGYFSGDTKVAFVGTTPESLIGANQGFFTQSISVGAGAVTILSLDGVAFVNPGLGTPVEPTISWTKLSISTDASPANPKDYTHPTEPGLGWSGSFQGIVVKKISPAQTKPCNPPSP
jgi:RHS repeat-associated protein